MQIILDGKPIPVNVRISRDLLVTLKGMSKVMNWHISYDAARELIYINTSTLAGSSAFASCDRLEAAPAATGEPESARLTGKIFCIDPGHGGSDPGACGPSGTMEKDNNLAISQYLSDKLEQNGATVFLTRFDDKDVAYPGASNTEELGARVDIANNAQVDLYIGIHNDSFTDRSATGTTTYHYGDKESIRLASCVQTKLIEKLGTKDRGTRFASLYVLRYTNMPAILIEPAFISNPEEELVLSSNEGRRNTADAIFSGIVQYFKV